MMDDRFEKVDDSLWYDSSEREMLGSGRCSFVFPGLLIEEGRHKKVAVKRFQRVALNESSIKHEVEVMLKAKGHPNILRYLYSTASTDKIFIFIATEFCQGTLEDYIKEPSKRVVEINEKEILHQLAEGLVHLHGLKMVHRDIKPRNILIFVPENNEGPNLVKLADFGLSKLLKPTQEDTTNSNVTNPSGTLGWIAPEMYTSDRYDLKVDIFPLGCIFAYTLNGGKHPFGDNEIDRCYKIKNKVPMQLNLDDFKKPYSNNYSAFELIRCMIQYEAQNRPTAEQVLSHSFFKVQNNAVENHTPSFDMVQTTSQFVQFCDKGALKKLSEAGMIHFVQRMAMNKTININATIPGGRTLLHYLCKKYANHDSLIYSFVLMLIERGAPLNSTDWNEDTPLIILCKNCTRDHLVDLVELFIVNGADIHNRTPDGWNLLHVLCHLYNNNNLIRLLRLLIEKGVHVNSRESQGSIPLHFLFAKYSHDNMIELVKLMIQNRVNVNAVNDGLWTPLHNLIYHYEHGNMIDIVHLLISYRANVNARTSMGFTPLHFLRKNSSLNSFQKRAIAQVLIANGAKN